jgi:DNA mismatch repair protein MSH3
LFWLIDHCKSSYGRRTLKAWLTRPLLKRDSILGRQELITWLSTRENSKHHSNDGLVRNFIEILQSFSDVERMLAALQFERIATLRLRSLLQLGIKVGTLQQLGDRTDYPSLLRAWLEGVDFECIVAHSTRYYAMLTPVESPDEDSLTQIFTPEAEKSFPELVQLSKQLDYAQAKIATALHTVRNILRMPALQFTTLRTGAISKTEHLIELPASFNKLLPDSWLKISSTKQVMRFHPPEVLAAQDELYRVRDELKLAAERIWKRFLTEVKLQLHSCLRAAIQMLGKVDAAMSLAAVAKYPGFICPCYPEHADELSIAQGRHPMLAKILEDSGSNFMPNDVLLRRNFLSRSCQVITGPNMGGTVVQCMLLNFTQ